MSTTFLASYLVLWALFLLQSFVILLLLRQVGVLHLRIGPAGARVLAVGPEIGQPVAPLSLVDMDNRDQAIQISNSMSKDVMLIFVTPGCANCASLMAALKPLVRQSKHAIVWAIIGSGGMEACRSFRTTHSLNFLLFAYDPKAGQQCRVNLSPYAVRIRNDGITISKGLVNHIEHVESLLELDSQTAPMAAHASV
jgi:methylamine dehydrogenase accessory protein MauD